MSECITIPLFRAKLCSSRTLFYGVGRTAADRVVATEYMAQSCIADKGTLSYVHNSFNWEGTIVRNCSG